MTRLWNNPIFPAFFGAVALLLATPAAADTLDMPSPPASQDQPAQGHSLTLPGRGMTMTAVEERFGQPMTRYDEVGDPPITRWVYPDFTVYFEYQYVINAVAHDDVGRPAQ